MNRTKAAMFGARLVEYADQIDHAVETGEMVAQAGRVKNIGFDQFNPGADQQVPGTLRMA